MTWPGLRPSYLLLYLALDSVALLLMLHLRFLVLLLFLTCLKMLGKPRVCQLNKYNASRRNPSVYVLICICNRNFSTA